MTIPRRPRWERGVDPASLDTREREAFLDWRRSLATVEQEHPGVVVTPFEKNIEVWRQLWRTVERSEVVVQIVDGRNPLMFYSDPLRRYVAEGGAKREFVGM
jgi:large subunit GTPase 1